jgi:hypothetical protein
MNSRTVHRSRRKVASTLEGVIDKIEEAASTLGEEVGTAGDAVQAEIAALPEQLEGLRRAVVTGVEPFRPPKRYRPYVQLGLLAMVVAAVITIVVRRRRGTGRSAATDPYRVDYRRSSDADGQLRPSSPAHAAQPESEGRQG